MRVASPRLFIQSRLIGPLFFFFFISFPLLHSTCGHLWISANDVITAACLNLWGFPGATPAVPSGGDNPCPWPCYSFFSSFSPRPLTPFSVCDFATKASCARVCTISRVSPLSLEEWLGYYYYSTATISLWVLIRPLFICHSLRHFLANAFIRKRQCTYRVLRLSCASDVIVPPLSVTAGRLQPVTSLLWNAADRLFLLDTSRTATTYVLV